MSDPPGFWAGALRRLGADMPAFTLEAWVKPLVPQAEDEGIRLLCPSAFHRDRVRERFLPQIERCLTLEAGRAVRVDLGVADGAACGSEAPPPPRIERRSPLPVRKRRSDDAAQRSFPYTFGSFVVGPCNALAREACLAVAHGRQQGLNPLYLVSEPGLGKTHLARAVVAETLESGGDRVLYASSEAFTNEFMSSIRARRMDRFKRRFREGCDLLVLEDVQFLASKAATQLELFHTIDHLLDAGARVVLSGDRMPRDIAGIEPRLRSQMSAGLVAQLEPPDARVRRRILSSKASSGGVRLPDDCLDLLVDSLQGSVRDLEGVLIQLVASASLLKQPIDLDLTRGALQKLAPALPEVRRLAPRAVIDSVARFFRTTPEALASRSRRRDVLLPRQLAMYLCHRYTDCSLSAIAAAFGRAHPAAANAIRVVERGILERAPLRYQLEALSARLDDLAARDVG